MLPRRTINQIALVVEDLDAAVRRYRDILGMSAELIEFPKERVESEAVFPPAGAGVR